MKRQLILLLVLVLHSWNVKCIFKQLLKKSPVIDRTDIWSRSIPNIAIYGNMTLSLRRSLRVPTPSYVQILSERILSVTSFSLLRKGCIMQFDLNNKSRSHTMRGEYLWPNELTIFKDKLDHPIMLIPDGFLLPGQSDGGLYAIRDPQLPSSSPIRITEVKPGWFYHRATHVILPGGQEGILTARARKPLFSKGEGELVWISIPKHISEGDFSKAHIEKPWPEIVLTKGPDVMFEVFDMDPTDSNVDIIAAHFFGQELSVLSIKAIPYPPYVQVSSKISLKTIGSPYGLCLARMTPSTTTMEGNNLIPNYVPISTRSTSTSGSTSIPTSTSTSSGYISSKTNEMSTASASCECDCTSPTHVLVSTHECSYDFPSAFNMIMATISGKYPRVRTGSTNIRSGDKLCVESGARSVSVDKGGGLYAYEIPKQNKVKGIDVSVSRSVSVTGSKGARVVSTSVPSVSKSASTATSISGKYSNSNRIDPLLSLSTLSIDRFNEIITEEDIDIKKTKNSSKTKREKEASYGIYRGIGVASSSSISIDSSSSSSSSIDSIIDSDVNNDNHVNKNNDSNEDKNNENTAHTADTWIRHTLFRGFKVRGWGGIFSPGAPGFPYVFRMPNKPHAPPLILLAGDCTGSAYVFAPVPPTSDADMVLTQSELPSYQLAFEVECGATVGSAAVSAPQDNSGDVEIFIPSYELNQVHVFRLSDDKFNDA